MKVSQSLPNNGPGIEYSHYGSRQVAGEQCVAEHGLSYPRAGSLLFVRKNFVAKFTKQPAENGPLRAITVVFDRVMLLGWKLARGTAEATCGPRWLAPP